MYLFFFQGKHNTRLFDKVTSHEVAISTSHHFAYNPDEDVLVLANGYRVSVRNGRQLSRVEGMANVYSKLNSSILGLAYLQSIGQYVAYYGNTDAVQVHTFDRFSNTTERLAQILRFDKGALWFGEVWGSATLLNNDFILEQLAYPTDGAAHEMFRTQKLKHTGDNECDSTYSQSGDDLAGVTIVGKYWNPTALAHDGIAITGSTPKDVKGIHTINITLRVVRFVHGCKIEQATRHTFTRESTPCKTGSELLEMSPEDRWSKWNDPDCSAGCAVTSCGKQAPCCVKESLDDEWFVTAVFSEQRAQAWVRYEHRTVHAELMQLWFLATYGTDGTVTWTDGVGTSPPIGPRLQVVRSVLPGERLLWGPHEPPAAVPTRTLPFAVPHYRGCFKEALRNADRTFIDGPGKRTFDYGVDSNDDLVTREYTPATCAAVCSTLTVPPAGNPEDSPDGYDGYVPWHRSVHVCVCVCACARACF